MGLDPADWLAAAATRGLPDAGPQHVLIPAPFERRLGALALDAAIVCILGFPVAFVLAEAAYDQFLMADGPPFEVSKGNVIFCLGVLCWCTVALLYTSVECLGWCTPGKVVATLRLVPRDRRRGRFLVRWMLAYLPLLAVAAVCAVAVGRCAWTRWLTNDSSVDVGEGPTSLLGFLAVTSVVFWITAFIRCAAPESQTLADWLAGVEVRCGARPPRKRPPRGFDVIPPTEPAPPPGQHPRA